MKTYREPIEWSNTWIDRWSTQAQDAYSSLREHFKYGTQTTHTLRTRQKNTLPPKC